MSWSMDDPSALSAAELQRKLAAFQNPSSAVLHARLAAAHPMHITRLARGAFLGMTALAGALIPATLLAPFLSPEAALILRDLDASLPIPSPMLAVVLTLCFAIAWVTAGQAALAVAYDCPLMPNEQKEYDKLRNQLDLFDGGASLVAELPASAPPALYMPQASLGRATPASVLSSGRPNPFTTPAPTPGGTLQYQAAPDPFVPIGQRRAPTPPAVSRSATPAPLKAATTPPAVGRSAGGLTYTLPEADAAVTDVPAPPPAGPRRPIGGYVLGPGLDGDATSYKPPRWGQINEPWLLDAIRKSEDLGRRYPVQAFIEYSAEPDLPFTLVLERATPAMAVRAMVEFVGFLASIATPKRARIELRNVVHLDRSFYRSVMSAMEPYFPDTVDIRQSGYRVEITFLEPERCWSRVPLLPLA
jgi:hypothetical protein